MFFKFAGIDREFDTNMTSFATSLNVAKVLLCDIYFIPTRQGSNRLKMCISNIANKGKFTITANPQA